MDEYKNRLQALLVYNGFLDAAANMPEICRGCSPKMIHDKLEIWKSWNNENQWFDYADRISQKNWYKKFKTEGLRY